MKTVTLTRLQGEEIAYQCELGMERRESDKSPHDDIDVEALYEKVRGINKRTKVSFTEGEVRFIQVEMSNAWTIHGRLDTVRDYESRAYHNMCKNLFKKLEIEQVD